MCHNTMSIYDYRNKNRVSYCYHQMLKVAAKSHWFIFQRRLQYKTTYYETLIRFKESGTIFTPLQSFCYLSNLIKIAVDCFSLKLSREEKNTFTQEIFYQKMSKVTSELQVEICRLMLLPFSLLAINYDMRGAV